MKHESQKCYALFDDLINLLRNRDALCKGYWVPCSRRIELYGCKAFATTLCIGGRPCTRIVCDPDLLSNGPEELTISRLPYMMNISFARIEILVLTYMHTPKRGPLPTRQNYNNSNEERALTTELCLMLQIVEFLSFALTLC
ncbi:hypothetical protein HAX54_044373, partial [Datura stramonium]|nr:hypothetical protein [Datura stramonium]